MIAGKRRVCIDRRGLPFEVGEFREDDYRHLEEMYDAFSPKGKYQGMPPAAPDACRQWLDRLLEGGENFLAWREGRVIGHAVALPDLDRRDAEYLIFVSRHHRGCGVGSALTLAVLERAHELGLRCLWLTVETYNIRATRLYRKFGFEYADAEKFETERMMTHVCS